jgi:hypothetical protein
VLLLSVFFSLEKCRSLALHCIKKKHDNNLQQYKLGKWKEAGYMAAVVVAWIHFFFLD